MQKKKKINKTERFTVVLPRITYQELLAEARANDMPLATYVRELIRIYFLAKN